MANLNSKNKILILSSVFAFSILLLIASFSLSSHAQISKSLAQSASNSDELSYLKFVASTIKQTNSVNSTVHIPDVAKGPQIPAKGYLLQKIHDNLYWVTDGIYNTMFLVSDQGVIAVDAPPSFGKNYLNAIAEVTDKPVKVVIYSHAHINNIGGASIFPKNATYIAQEETSAILKES